MHRVNKSKSVVGAKRGKNEKDKEDDDLPMKIFVARNSLLTDLYEIEHIRTIHNIFGALFIIFLIKMAIFDYIRTGSLDMGFETVNAAFGKNITISIALWFFILFWSLSTHTLFWLWTLLYSSCKTNFMQRISYAVYIIAHIVHQILCTCIPAAIILKAELPLGSSFALLLEQIRMLMKNHAFVRSNVPKILNFEIKDNKSASSKAYMACPEFSKFLYFLFAPTLIYQDNYPRTKSTNWERVFVCAIELGMALFLMLYTVDRIFVPTYTSFGPRIPSSLEIVYTIYDMAIPIMMIYLTGFYIVFHALQNATAELLRFADREFYTDWWNSTSYFQFWRRWNILVHDWLYVYVYRDFHWLFRKHKSCRGIGQVAVFVISALFHEYAMILTFRFVYPVMFSLFGGLSLLFLAFGRDRLKNFSTTFMWYGYLLGNSTYFNLYAIEYYARCTCAPRDPENPMIDLFLPRSWVDCVPR